MVKRWVLLLIVFSLVVGLGLGALMDRALEEQAARLTQEAEQAQESEYYRGVFDACLWFMAQYVVGYADAAVCNSWTAGVSDGGWYEDPSPGFDLPDVQLEVPGVMAILLSSPDPVCDVDAVMSLANEAAHLAGRNFGGMLTAQEFRAEAVPLFGSLRAELNACGYQVDEYGELVGPGE